MKICTKLSMENEDESKDQHSKELRWIGVVDSFHVISREIVLDGRIIVV